MPCLIPINWRNNISRVNALSLVMLYVQDCSKGRGQQKRTWGIEKNETRETYLKNYIAVDKIDQMLLGWDLSYRSWRWWHAPTRHAKAIAMSMAYSLYLQCAKGTVDKRMESHSCIRTKVSSEDVSSDGTV